MIQLDVEWGRAKSGRVWHLLSHRTESGADTAFCEIEAPMREVTRGLQPRGARVCPVCRDVVDALARTIELAVANESPARPTGQ